MKNMLFIIAIITFGMSFLQGCKKDKEETPPVAAPVAGFTFTGAGNPAPCAVIFTNSSTNASTYVWDFGDGSTTETTTSPTHTFTTGGTFTVQLTATGNGSNSIQKTVNILNPTGPVASFTYSGAGGYAPCNVVFTNSSVNSTSYSWNFGDGGTSTTASPSHTFTTGGTFTVQLTANGIGGSHSTSQTINILAPPTTANIKKITVTAMPFIDPGSGSGWDPSNGPDVFFQITDVNNTVLYDGSGSTISDVTQISLPISWDFSAPYYSVPDINTAIYIDLTDYDTLDPNDYIGWCGPFTLSTFTTYPATVSKTSNGITVTLDIQWQ